MDFPLFFLDFIGNRLFMAIVAITHVFINHPFAVGAYPLMVLLEWIAFKKNNKELDELIHKMVFVIFIVTTTVGALTGVGIWLYSSLIAPFGIGSLLRVFFWAWFIEWFVFITEVILILIYYLTWKKWSKGLNKKRHIGVGVALAIFSWITMALIVAILGFMMNTGNWNGEYFVNRSLIDAFFNPIYLPQLAFRTPYAMVTGGLLAWLFTFFFTKKESKLRNDVIRMISIWIICWIPLCLAGAIWYWNVVPSAMQANTNVALLTQAFMHWHDKFLSIVQYTVGAVVLVAAVGIWRPRMIPGIVLMIPFLISVWLLGHFERVREFVRKPYVIGGYMYANGVRTTELPVYQRDGMLAYATYVKHNKVTDSNKVEAGRDVFMIACSRCHTSKGFNGVVDKFNDMYGKDKKWNDAAMASFIKTMHTSRTYMPPFPGNDAEVDALVAYLKSLRKKSGPIHGVQAIGLEKNVQITDTESEE